MKIEVEDEYKNKQVLEKSKLQKVVQSMMKCLTFWRILIISSLLIIGLTLNHSSQRNSNDVKIQSLKPIAIDDNLEQVGKQGKQVIDEGQVEDDNVEVGSGVEIPGAGLSIIFIFGSLLYGSILKVFCRFLSVPYNPLLLISGIILGMYYQNLGIVGDSIDLISRASPSGILAIFLPVLIFESVFKTQWHLFKKLTGQSLILGILSTLVSASLIMLLVKFYLDSQNKFYDWDDAFIMGSILSCTDILSFVNRLKRVGTPQKVTALLQGESLFNYCTCVLIVQLMHYYQEVQETAGFWQYLNLFMIEVGGGIIFGVAVGMVAVYCIRRMIYDGILVVTLMVIFTYSIYLLAEFSTMKISGIVSLAIFALYMNAFGKAWVSGQTAEFVTSFWSYMVFVAQTNIFMIAGVMVGSTIVHLHFASSDVSIWSQVFASVVIYLFAVVARFLSIGVFYKFLKNLGEGMTWKEVILITFAGLKGAIGIALAMLIFKSKQLAELTSYLIMIHVTANSIITFIIHGTSAGLMVKLLGLSSLKKVEYKFFKQYLFSFKANVHERLLHLKEQAKEDNMIDWTEVQTRIGLEQYSHLGKVTDDIIANKQFKQKSAFQKSLMFKLQNAIKEYSRHQASAIQEQMKQKIAQFDLQVQFRKRFIKDLIAKYWQFHDENQTSPGALMLLIQSANYDLDRQTEQIESWSWIKNEISFNMRLFSQLMKVTLIKTLAKSSLFQYVSFCEDVVSSYIKAHQQVREEISIFYQKSQHANEDQERFVLENILRESQQNQKQAQFFLTNYLEPSFPQIQQQVKTRKVSFFILNTFKNIVDKNNQNGQLQPNQYDMLYDIIMRRSLKLNLSSPVWQETDFLHILSQNRKDNVFRLLPQPVLRLLSRQLSQKYTFDGDEKIIESGEIAKYFFFVKKGGCIVQFTNKKLVYKEPMLSGQVFGFEGLVTNIYHSKATTNTMAEIVNVKKNLILKLFETFPYLEEAFWKNYIFQCYKMFQKKGEISYRISQLQREQVEELMSNFKLKCINPKIIEDPSEDMIFIRGNIQVTAMRDQKSLISPVLKKYASVNDTFVSTQNPPPFYFISQLVETTVRIKQPSLFLVGNFNYEVFEIQAVRLSRSKTWKVNKKKEVVLQKSPHQP